MSKNNIIINEVRTGFPVVKNGYPVKVTYLEGYFHKTTMEGGIPPFYLETLVINEGIEEIGDSAVAYSEKLTTIKFPSTLKEIGRSAFEGCTNLKYFIVLNPKLDIRNISLPDGCKIICPGKEVETI